MPTQPAPTLKLDRLPPGMHEAVLNELAVSPGTVQVAATPEPTGEYRVAFLVASDDRGEPPHRADEAVGDVYYRPDYDNARDPWSSTPVTTAEAFAARCAEPHAVRLDRSEHGLVQYTVAGTEHDPWDTTPNAAVWVPNDSVLSGLPAGTPEVQRAWLYAQAWDAAEQLTAWANGAVFEVYEGTCDPLGNLLPGWDDASVGTFYGRDRAEAVIADSVAPCTIPPRATTSAATLPATAVAGRAG